MATADGAQRSGLKDFLASIATIKGDLSNITAPPFVIADKSTTEFPRYWIEHPALFCAANSQPTPEKRLLAVLKWFLSSLKSQQYAGREPSEGIKKPLNAFLGELFLGEIGDEGDVTRLVSEQVSHHPPVTACYLWNEKTGVKAEGYTRQEITFSGSVNIQQIGHAVLTLGEEGQGESFLVPLPDIRVKGVVSGSPYPELVGSYELFSSAGFVATVDFTGKGMLGIGGSKNHVEAGVYAVGDKKREKAIYTAEGSWSEKFVFKDEKGKEVDEYDVANAAKTEFRTADLSEQDPWESRKAWQGVIQASHTGDMQGVSDKKSELENAQRELRKHSETGEEAWEALFFRKEKSNPMAEKLLGMIGQKLEPENTCGVWRFDAERAAKLERPYRKGLTPFGKE